MKKNHKTDIKKIIQSVRHLVKKHMPHFHNAWHMKVDFHAFRYILVGLGIFLLFVFVIIVANFNSIRQFAIGSYADETDSTGTIRIEAKENEPNEWLVIARPEAPNDRLYVSYVVEISNIYDESGNQQLQFTNFYYGDEGIDLIEISQQDSRFVAVARLNPSKAGSIIPEEQTLFEIAVVGDGVVPEITNSFLYYLEGNGFNANEITAFREERLSLPRSEDDSDEETPSNPTPEQGESNPSVTLPVSDGSEGALGIRQANDFCRETHGLTHNKFRGCYIDNGTRVATCGQQSICECNSGDCGEDKFIENAPAYLCNAYVPCSDNSGAEDEPPNFGDGDQAPPQDVPGDNVSDSLIRCYTNEYCSSVGAGDCTNGSCSRAEIGFCSQSENAPNAPDESPPNQWCGDRFGRDAEGGNSGGSGRQQGGGDSGNGNPRDWNIQSEAQCDGSTYIDENTFTDNVCICTANQDGVYLIVPMNQCQ